MPTNYPDALDTDANFPDRTDDIDDVMAIHVTNIQDALKAIEAELGVLPKGTFADVKARLDSYTNWKKYTQSAGRVSGCTISDAGAGKINAASGVGYFKTTDSEIGITVILNIAATSNVELTDNSINYIHVNYNAGTPAIQVTTDRTTIELNREFTLARVYRSGTTLHIVNSGVNLPNFFRKEHERLLSVRNFERASGGDISGTGTRNIASDIGNFYLGLNKITTTAKDTSVADKFTAWYRNGAGGWTPVINQTQIDNANYDDGTGTLHALTSNRYGVFWVYIHYDSDLQVVYGRDNYKLTEAQDAVLPDSLPPQVYSFGTLAAKIIIGEGAATFTIVASAYKTLFPVSIAPTQIHDIDGDTSLDTEETPDKDEIQGKVGGVEFFRGHSDGIVTLAKQSGCRVFLQTTDQTIPSGTPTKIEYNAETYDLQNEFDPTTNYRFTAKKAGYYLAYTQAFLRDLPDGQYGQQMLNKNGGITAVNRIFISALQWTAPFITNILYLAVNDYIEGFIRQDTGANKDIYANTSYTYMVIQKIA